MGSIWTRRKAFKIPDGKCLNLGCGHDRRPDAINADINAAVRPDVIFDLNHIPWPFCDSAFSRIIMKQVYEHLTVHSTLVFQETYRLLVPNGVLDLVYPNMFSLKNRLRYLTGRISVSDEWHPYHTKLVCLPYLEQLLRHIGFDVARVRHTKLPFYELSEDDVHLLVRKRP